MATAALKKTIEKVPHVSNHTDMLFYVKKNKIDGRYLNYLREASTFSDTVISDWLNISVKTLRTYTKPDTDLKDNIKEHLVMILSLYSHGADVFGNTQNFDEWLTTGNFYFDGKAPRDFIDTVSGIKHIDDQLTAMEYGDNA